MLRRKNGSRKGILTLQNREHLKSNKTTQKNLKRIQGDVKERLQALSEDLEIISNAENLKTWRNGEFGLFQTIKETVSDIAFSFKPTYQYAVQRYKKNTSKKKLFVYWIDILDESPIREEKIFEPSFALRKLRSKISKEDYDILTKSVENNIVPFHKENAKPVEAFESAFQNEKKFDELKAMAFYKEKPTITLKPDIAKRRKEFKLLWKLLNNNWDKIDKKIAKYGISTARKVDIFDKTKYFDLDYI